MRSKICNNFSLKNNICISTKKSDILLRCCLVRKEFQLFTVRSITLYLQKILHQFSGKVQGICLKKLNIMSCPIDNQFKVYCIINFSVFKI